jgi:hypothetical protein
MSGIVHYHWKGRPLWSCWRPLLMAPAICKLDVLHFAAPPPACHPRNRLRALPLRLSVYVGLPFEVPRLRARLCRRC